MMFSPVNTNSYRAWLLRLKLVSTELDDTELGFSGQHQLLQSLTTQVNIDFYRAGLQTNTNCYRARLLRLTLIPTELDDTELGFSG